MNGEAISVIDRVRIFEVRGQAVVLDSDLAPVYGVTMGNFNKAVKRNLERFPEDFTFVLSQEEFGALIFHFGTPKGRGGRRKQPRVFTEHGAIMAATILNSPRAVATNGCGGPDAAIGAGTRSQSRAVLPNPYSQLR